MRKRIIALLLALILTVGLLPTVALAAEGDTPAAGTSNDVKNGYYDSNKEWVEGTPTQTLPKGVQEVSKNAVKKADNTYEVTLKVVLKQTSETKTGAAATALVLDCSGSMDWCTECGQDWCRHKTDDTYNVTFDVHNSNSYYVLENGKYVRVSYCDGYHFWGSCDGGAGWYTEGGRKDHTPDKKFTPMTSVDDTNTAHTQFYTRTGGSSDTSRMTAAKNAAKNFLKTYSGFDASAINDDGTLTSSARDLSIKRYVAVIRFSDNIDNNKDRGGRNPDYKYEWYDVSTVVGYNKVLATINNASAGGGTNLDAGLTTASSLMDANLVKNLTSKNVIALTDGAPTYSKTYGTGGSTNKDICDETAKTAETLRVKSKVYTVCFAAESDPLYNGGGTVGNFLKNRIATQPAEGSNEKYAYNAKSAEDLIKVFKDITDTIVSGLNNGTVKDSLPAGITSTDFGNATQFELNDQKQFHKDVKTETVDGKEVTTYTYTKTYTVNINPDEVQATVDGYAPLNEETTLTVTVDGKEEKIPFPIPAGKVTPTTFTVTWKSQDGNTELEKDENVAKNSKPSYDGATPTKAEDDMYTYTFVGWALSDGQETGTSAADLPNVTADVTYYAAFSEQLKQYAVTGTIDNNGAVTGSGQKVNAGGSSAAMTFTPAAGYKIISVKEKVGEVETTITDFAETGYTYPVKNDIRANITVDVKTAKRSDLKYVVKHVEKDNATNVLATRDKTGTLDEVIHGEAQKENFTGFTYAECSPESIKISATEDNNVITLYYTRNKHNITYQYESGAPTDAPDVTSYNETNVPYDARKERQPAPSLAGWTFSGWTTTDVTVGTDGKFNMPNKDVVFKGNWTEKDKVTITYVVVGPTGCGTVTPASETPYVDADANAVSGSEATATDSYRFVGWYAEESCTTLLTAESHYTPRKTGDHWTSAIYYAKFEAIPKPDADDLPKVAVICTNDVMGHDASNTELTGSTYTVGRTQYENGVYTCKVTLNQTQGHIDTYNASNPGHTDDATNANVEKITLTYDAARQTWTKSADTFKIYVVCNTTEFDVTYNWTGLDGATFESNVEPKQPLKATVTKGGKHTVDTDYKAGDIRVATNGDKYRFSGWSSATEGVVINENGEITNIQNNITLTGHWTKLGSGTFDLNDKIFKVFDEADGSRDIPRSSYTFEVKVTRLDKETNELTDEKYTGTVTLDGATAAATPSFVFNDPITFHTGDEYRFLVEEKSNTVTALSSDERIDYDNAEYYLYVTVSDDLKTINYRFEHVLVITSAEEEPAATENQPITFHNYYYAAKDPGTYDINFSDLVFKVLTKTGDRSFNGAEFTATVEGWQVNQYDVMSARVIKTHFVDLQPVTLKATFPADTTFDADGKAYRAFTGDKLTVTEGEYLFLIDEINDGQTNITYDESKYWLNLGFVENAEGEVSLAGQRVRKFVDGDTYETVLALEDSEWMIVDTSISPVYFENTIDTGKDDYYPIIIPTIINKDTGMLNKTDHFAYVIGYPDGTVHPNGQITRAEVATIFFRLLRDEVRDGAFTTSNTYSDVAYGKWYNNPISTMSALGIITGYPDGTFKPNKPITRAEFAAIAARFDETQSGKSATFSDVIGHWAAKEIGIAYYNDWIKGYPDGTFKPDQNITRAEAMTLINRVLERKPESPADLLTNMNKWTDNMDTSKWYYLDVQEATNSHGYTRKTFNYELWRQMLPDPDWSRYER